MKREVLRHKIPWNQKWVECQIVVEEEDHRHRFSCEFYALVDRPDDVVEVRHLITGVIVAGIRSWDRWFYEYRERESSWRRTTTLELVEVDE